MIRVSPSIWTYSARVRWTGARLPRLAYCGCGVRNRSHRFFFFAGQRHIEDRVAFVPGFALNIGILAERVLTFQLRRSHAYLFSFFCCCICALLVSAMQEQEGRAGAVFRSVQYRAVLLGPCSVGVLQDVILVTYHHTGGGFGGCDRECVAVLKIEFESRVCLPGRL